MDSLSSRLPYELAIPPKAADILLASPAGMAIRHMSMMAKHLTDRGYVDDAKIVIGRMRNVASSVTRDTDVTSSISAVSLAKTRDIADQAREKGWTDFELWGCSSDYRIQSFAQLYIEGSDITDIASDKITFVTPTGNELHVWRHNVD